MGRKEWRWLQLMLLCLLLCACSRAGLQDEAPEVLMELAVDPDPPLFGRPCQLTITLLDEAQAPIDDALLTIEGDMTHAGMVPVITQISQGQSGVYTTSFDWSMAGDWILTIAAELSDGRIARRAFELVVGVPGG